MIDNEIIEALEWAVGIGNNEYTGDIGVLCDNALSLIQKQQKELSKYENLKYCDLLQENEILRSQTLMDDRYNEVKVELEKLRFQNAILTAPVALIKSNAIKEFANRLKATITINNTNDGILDYSIDYNCLIEDIDNLVTEMTEGKDNA